jgi:hypothetical protein
MPPATTLCTTILCLALTLQSATCESGNHVGDEVDENDDHDTEQQDINEETGFMWGPNGQQVFACESAEVSN